MWEITLVGPVNDWFLDISAKDPRTARQVAEAIRLLAGDKNGEWSRWYDINIPLAEARYEQYISEKDKGARA
ncbi:hypothetical protein [Kitasatospora sp. NPDC058190]|uniref:hypothetical protein n=1 Tax=Kitasatospora sp. NPDC058190 TaxID=3346371 RepID=UPI0036DE6247